MRQVFGSAHMIFQLEQGLDYFLLPGRSDKKPWLSPFLQDNVEDWLALREAWKTAVDNSIPMFIIQTNSGLDQGKGIHFEPIAEYLRDKCKVKGFKRPDEANRLAIDLGRPEGRTKEQ